MANDRIAIQHRLIQALAIGGILVSFYLYLFHEGKVFLSCGPDAWDDCGAVSGPGAKYASFAGISVAMMGIVGYSAQFMIVWLADLLKSLRDGMGSALLVTSSLALLFSAYLIYLEAFVLEAFCRYCLVSAAIALAIFLLSLSGFYSARRERNNDDI